MNAKEDNEYIKTWTENRSKVIHSVSRANN